MSMPTGGTDSPSGGQATQPGPQSGAATAPWLPVFRIGQGQPGVFADARGMIAGELATVTAKDMASSAGGIASAMTGAIAGAVAGANEGSEIGAQEAGTMPTAGTDAPANANGQPTPKATSQAQREANLNNAYSQYGLQNPDPSVP